jgi:hypothetical protein
MPRKKLEDLDKPTATPTPAVTKPDAVVVATQDTTTRKVKLDLEVDTSVKDLGPNPYVKLIHMAKAVDSWRIFPRIFITVYIILLYQVVHWYMNLGTSATMNNQVWLVLL